MLKYRWAKHEGRVDPRHGEEELRELGVLLEPVEGAPVQGRGAVGVAPVQHPHERLASADRVTLR